MSSNEKCAICGTNEPTLFFQYCSLDGEKHNIGVCDECVADRGLDSNSVDGIMELFDFDEEINAAVIDVGIVVPECPQCGTSFTDILDSGCVGCETCYQEYRSLIE